MVRSVFFKGLADGEFTIYVEVIDGDIGLGALVFIEGEAKPTSPDDIIGLEKLKDKKYNYKCMLNLLTQMDISPFVIV